MAPQTYQLSITVEYEAANDDSARYVEGAARRELQEMFPDALVRVKGYLTHQLRPIDERAA